MDTIGSTVTHTPRVHSASYSSCERIVKQHLDELVPQLDQNVQDVSRTTNKLVIGIDDFAIRIILASTIFETVLCYRLLLDENWKIFAKMYENILLYIPYNQ